MEHAAHRGFIQTSDFLLFLNVFLGAVLEYFTPSSFQLIPETRWTIGCLLILCGWLLILITKRELKKFSQPSKPGVATSALITSGIFSLSRNPIYLGMLVLNISLGILLDSIWVSASTFVFFFTLYYFLIIPEERYLQEKFGDAFVHYTKSVRRWF